jgi:chemotaxis protein MotB
MATKQKCPEFENHERWLISYADMVTLLFALFVVMYALKESGGKAQEVNKVVAASVADALNMPLPDIPVDRKAGPTSQGFGIFENFKGDQLREPVIQKYRAGERPKVIDLEMNKVKIMVEDRLYGPNKYPQTSAKGQERIVSVERTPQGFKLQLAARHFFGSGEYQMKRSALKEMERLGGILVELGRPIVVEGHTDNVPAGGQFSNWEISSLRAASVAKYLIKTAGFPATKMAIAGYADLKPVAQNTSEAGRAMNRRIEIHINYDPDSANTETQQVP